MVERAVGLPAGGPGTSGALRLIQRAPNCPLPAHYPTTSPHFRTSALTHFFSHFPQTDITSRTSASSPAAARSRVAQLTAKNTRIESTSDSPLTVTPAGNE